MGARQSKRSVDITTGKEAVAEGGEIAGAGGEGKLERIEDLDNLKPQVNGDAAHQEVEISDKEKKMQQDEVAENEKDNEKEKEIILTPVNGDSAEPPKEVVENIEAETNKKNKKEKTKRKWSFRSISFSKKDKQKPAKKEETNGECEKVPEEGADNNAAAAAAEQPEVKAEVAEVKEAEKVQEKTPETPVTEPLTNGSSAPETPKEEIRQNGEAESAEQSPVVEKKEEEAPAPPKEETPAEVPSVESLPINGLQIEETVEEVKQEAVKSIPEPVEVKTEIAESEVCVLNPEVARDAEVKPPPLPTTPPPSSLTIFAESTMAPSLVDKPDQSQIPEVPQEVQPVVDEVSSTPVQDDAKPIETPAVVSPSEPISETQTVEPVKDDLTPPASVDAAPVSEPEPVAPISEPEPVTPVPEPELPPAPVSEPVAPVSEPELPPAPEAPVELPPAPQPESLEISAPADLPPAPVPEPIEAPPAAEKPEASEPIVENVNIAPVSEAPASQVEAEIVEPPVNNLESPLAQSPSEPDVSEVAPSDSFPPPPPPVSCPESMTENSVSESLPPPPADLQSDTVINSPTSESVDFPPKDSEIIMTNGDAHPTTTTPESEPIVAEPPKELDEAKKSPDVTQVKAIIDSDVINTDIPAVADSIPTEASVVAAAE